MKEQFDLKWKENKYIWKVDGNKLTITKMENPRTREIYEDMYYRNVYFFSLSEAKKHIKKNAIDYTPEGHLLTTHKVEEYKIIKPIKINGKVGSRMRLNERMFLETLKK